MFTLYLLLFAGLTVLPCRNNAHPPYVYVYLPGPSMALGSYSALRTSSPVSPPLAGAWDGFGLALSAEGGELFEGVQVTFERRAGSA